MIKISHHGSILTYLLRFYTKDLLVVFDFPLSKVFSVVDAVVFALPCSTEFSEILYHVPFNVCNEQLRKNSNVS